MGFRKCERRAIGKGRSVDSGYHEGESCLSQGRSLTTSASAEGTEMSMRNPGKEIIVPLDMPRR
jgi:hypothetical protein